MYVVRHAGFDGGYFKLYRVVTEPNRRVTPRTDFDLITEEKRFNCHEVRVYGCFLRDFQHDLWRRSLIPELQTRFRHRVEEGRL